METILDYVQRQTRDFTVYSFHAADALVFADLTYDKIPSNVPRLCDIERHYGTTLARIKNFDMKRPLHSARAIVKVPYEGLSMRQIEAELSEYERTDNYLQKSSGFVNPSKTHEFYRSTARNPRFAVVRMNAIEERLDPVTQTQFAAMTFLLPTGQLVIAFRGTDDSMVGWREDLNMSFTYPVIGQKLAADYLESVARLWSGPIILTGHSKGGNLAIYAAMNANDDVKDRIEHIYSLDGPGFPTNVVKSYEYLSIADRITKVLPEFSMIGMLLESSKREHKIVVRSSGDGIMQHSAYTWMMKGDYFDTADDIAQSSKNFSVALNAWLSTLTQRQREHGVDALFRILTSSGKASMSEIMEAGPRIIPSLLGTYIGLSSEERKYINQAMMMIASAALTKNPNKEN